MTDSLKNKISIITKTFIIILLAIFVDYKSNINVSNAKNINLNINENLGSLNILELPIEKEIQLEEQLEITEPTEEIVQEPVQVIEEPIVQEQSSAILASYTGKITGYVYNCPGCSGKLACDSSLDLSNGNVTYNDTTYGNVNIVAASSNLACGSIVEINSSMSDTPMLAIVLDRGVQGTTLDLLTPSVEYAINNVGSREATYNVLRNGY